MRNRIFERNLFVEVSSPFSKGDSLAKGTLGDLVSNCGTHESLLLPPGEGRGEGVIISEFQSGLE